MALHGWQRADGCGEVVQTCCWGDLAPCCCCDLVPCCCCDLVPCCWGDLAPCCWCDLACCCWGDLAPCCCWGDLAPCCWGDLAPCCCALPWGAPYCPQLLNSPLMLLPLLPLLGVSGGAATPLLDRTLALILQAASIGTQCVARRSLPSPSSTSVPQASAPHSRPVPPHPSAASCAYRALCMRPTPTLTAGAKGADALYDETGCCTGHSAAPNEREDCCECPGGALVLNGAASGSRGGTRGKGNTGMGCPDGCARLGAPDRARNSCSAWDALV